MKNNLLFIFALLALVFSIAAFYNSTNATKGTTGKRHFGKAEKETEEEIEIADLMLYVQHFHNKVYLASKEGNASLTTFYLNEMGEKMNEIAKANIWSNDVNISENMRTYGLKAVDAMLAKSPQEVFATFDNLTQACNSCHAASKHDNIKIITPVNAVYYNQDFK